MKTDDKITDNELKNEELMQEDSNIVDDSDNIEIEEKEDAQKIDKLDNELDMIKDQFLRLQADFANYKRRTETEKKDYMELGIKKVMLDLLQITDNFERAIKLKDEQSKFSEGIEMIYKQLMSLLERNDVKEIEAMNAEFNPILHHAVLVEIKDGVPAGIVIDVLQKGYMIGEKVLRPSMVKVSE